MYWDATKKRRGEREALANEKGKNRELTFLFCPYILSSCACTFISCLNTYTNVFPLEKYFFISFLWWGRPTTLLFREIKSLYFHVEPSWLQCFSYLGAPSPEGAGCGGLETQGSVLWTGQSAASPTTCSLSLSLEMLSLTIYKEPCVKDPLPWVCQTSLQPEIPVDAGAVTGQLGLPRCVSYQVPI